MYILHTKARKMLSLCISTLASESAAYFGSAPVKYSNGGKRLHTGNRHLRNHPGFHWQCPRWRASGRKQHPTRQWHRGKGVVERSPSFRTAPSRERQGCYFAGGLFEPKN